MHCLSQEQTLPVTRPELWDFVATPENLNRITPPDMEFEIIGDLPPRIYSGQLIEYRVKVPLMGRISWLTEIKHVVEGVSFVDEQRLGPYKLWIHKHGLEDVESGTKMIDEVLYALPYSLLGEVVHSIWVRTTLERIFRYRYSELKNIFPPKPSGFKSTK